MSSFRHNAAASACSDGIAASSFETPPPADLRLHMPIYITHLCRPLLSRCIQSSAQSHIAFTITFTIIAVEPGFIMVQEEPKAAYVGFENITMLRSWRHPSLVWNFLD